MTPTDKKTLRSHFRQVRRGIPDPRRQADSAAIAGRLAQHPAWIRAKSLFCYRAMGSEVDTRALMRQWLDSGRILALPRMIDDRRMEAVVVRHLEACEPDPRQKGWWISGGGPVLERSPDLALVPGLAWTLRGQRLGQGGGCYDLYFAQHPETIRIALAFDEQIVPWLPVEPHDAAMHWIITPTRAISCSG